MTALVKGLIVGGLLASTAAAPALAQYHDRPQANRSSRHVVTSRKVVKYREVTTSRGHKFRRGQRLAANQRRYVVSDWGRRGLRAPPRGYQWVRESNNTGDYLLIAAATGVIASILSQ